MMSPHVRNLFLLLPFLTGSLQQLQVQILQRYDRTVCVQHAPLPTQDGGSNQRCNSTTSQHATVLAEYIYPQGFSKDWYSTSYANIPPEGITGLLIHQPQSSNGECTRFTPSTEDCSSRFNFSMLFLVEDYRTCIGSKISSAQEAGFSGMISYSTGNEYLDIEDKVYDDAAEKVVDIVSSGFPLAVVSKAFGGTLLSIAAINNCSDTNVKLVRVSVGPIDVNAIRLAMSMLIICSGLFGVLLFPICCAWIFYKYWRRRSGSYSVYSYQMQELGSTTPGEVHERTHSLLYIPKKQIFDLKDGESSSTCPICLDLFVDGEVVSGLGCNGKHLFHPSCISRWLTTQSTCPVCRTFLHSNIQTDVL